MPSLTPLSSRLARRTATLAVTAALGTGLVLSGCSNSSAPSATNQGDGGSGGSCKGGPATGTADTHCGSTVQATGVCRSDANVDAGGGGDAGAEQTPAVLYGTEGDDDDCKYHVAIKVPGICENEETVIELTLTSKVDGKAVTGADVHIEELLDGGLGPVVTTATKEKPGGVYEVPALFDKPGQWEARFHFFETCSDAPPDSPHGHVGFYLDVP